MFCFGNHSLSTLLSSSSDLASCGTTSSNSSLWRSRNSYNHCSTSEAVQHHRAEHVSTQGVLETNPRNRVEGPKGYMPFHVSVWQPRGFPPFQNLNDNCRLPTSSIVWEPLGAISAIRQHVNCMPIGPLKYPSHHGPVSPTPVISEEVSTFTLRYTPHSHSS